MLYRMLASSAARFADKNAVETPEKSITYAELLRSVDAYSARLAAAGLGTGDPVLLLLPNGIEFIAAAFAIARLGAIIVPVNTSFRPKELRFYLQDAGPRAAITTPALAAQHGDLIREVSPDCAIMTTDDLPIGESVSGSVADRVFEGPLQFHYSSGSTGVPKRVMRTQAQLAIEMYGFTTSIGLSDADRVLAVIPMSHGHGFANCMLASMRVGATVVVLPSFNRRQVFDALKDGGISVFPAVPFVYGILADSPSIEPTRFPALRLAFSGSVALEKKVFDAFRDKFGIPIRGLYGATEIGVALGNLGSTEGELWASVGKPLLDVEMKIVDESGKPVAAGEIGELRFRCPGMASGYAALKEETERSFVDGYFRTGDLGRTDADGNVFVTGRTRLFINVGGNKVDPAEVETVIAAHPAVSECVVIGVRAQGSHEIVKAVVIKSGECRADELREWCRGKIADFKVPRIVEFRDEIPRSPLGKVLRKQLEDEPPRA